MTLRKYLVLVGVTIFGSTGDTLLSHGMKQTGSVSIHDLPVLIYSVLNPWVAVGILLLLAFFAAYMNALSWADLTYVLPASSLGYVVLALLGRFALHEQVSPMRWTGIVLICSGVGFVAGGPSVTSQVHSQHELPADSAAMGISEIDGQEMAGRHQIPTHIEHTRHIQS